MAIKKLLSAFAIASMAPMGQALPQADPPPSWSDAPTKAAIVALTMRNALTQIGFRS